MERLRLIRSTRSSGRVDLWRLAMDPAKHSAGREIVGRL